jgi:hypothetical protein
MKPISSHFGAVLAKAQPKPQRLGRFYSINVWTLPSGRVEYRLKLGNKIISRHATSLDAEAAYYAATDSERAQ